MNHFKLLFMIVFVLAFILGFIWLALVIKLKMPGRSYRGPLSSLSATENALVKELSGYVLTLSGEIGERNYWQYQQLNQAADFIEREFRGMQLPVKRQSYELDNKTFYNIEASILGEKFPDKVLIIGAHYDSVQGSPGANDNGSGVAALLSLANLLKASEPAMTIRFVAFTNEEPPFFLSHKMGSYIYAKQMHEDQVDVKAMISLETMGYYSDQRKTQSYPLLLSWFYPSQGDFIGFVSNVRSKPLLEKSIKLFRQHAQFPSEGIAAPSIIPGINWSDQWSFWKFGYPAIMVTDTAFYRYPFYHSGQDIFDKIDYNRLARVVYGLSTVIENLAAQNEEQ